jgi:hypothetical protein
MFKKIVSQRKAAHANRWAEARKENIMPIVELEKGVWLAAWQGDPGRTLDIRSAKHFETYKAAEFALMGARNYRPFANAVIRPTSRALDAAPIDAAQK